MTPAGLFTRLLHYVLLYKSTVLYVRWTAEAAGCCYHLLIVRRGGVTRCKYVMATAAHLQGVDRPGTATN